MNECAYMMGYLSFDTWPLAYGLPKSSVVCRHADFDCTDEWLVDRAVAVAIPGVAVGNQKKVSPATSSTQSVAAGQQSSPRLSIVFQPGQFTGLWPGKCSLLGATRREVRWPVCIRHITRGRV